MSVCPKGNAFPQHVTESAVHLIACDKNFLGGDEGRRGRVEFAGHPCTPQALPVLLTRVQSWTGSSRAPLPLLMTLGSSMGLLRM